MEHVSLQVVEKIRETVARLPVDVAADEVGQLVRVLADGGDLDRSGPVEVEVAHHVREELHLVWLEAGVILRKVISYAADWGLVWMVCYC